MTIVVRSADNFNHALQYVSQFSTQNLLFVLDFNIPLFHVIWMLCSHSDVMFFSRVPALKFLSFLDEFDNVHGR